MNYSQSLMSDPSAGLGPIKTAGQDSINRRFSAMPGKISQNMASRGYGSSGDMGNTMYQTELARSGEMGDWESKIAQMMLAQKNQGASLATDILKMGRGEEGVNVQPGNGLAAGLGSASASMGNIATMLMLQKSLAAGSQKQVYDPFSPGSNGDYRG